MGNFTKLILISLLGLTSCAPRVQTVTQLMKDLSSPNPKKAQLALIKLTQIGDPKALDAVIQYSENKSVPERIQAILAARQFKDKRALPWLFVLSTGHPDASVRNAASEALTSIQNQDNKTPSSK